MILPTKKWCQNCLRLYFLSPQGKDINLSLVVSTPSTFWITCVEYLLHYAWTYYIILGINHNANWKYFSKIYISFDTKWCIIIYCIEINTKPCYLLLVISLVKLFFNNVLYVAISWDSTPKKIKKKALHLNRSIIKKPNETKF